MRQSQLHSNAAKSRLNPFQDNHMLRQRKCNQQLKIMRAPKLYDSKWRYSANPTPWKSELPNRTKSFPTMEEADIRLIVIGEIFWTYGTIRMEFKVHGQ